MLAATNESVAELNRAAQRLRLAAGEVVQPIRAVRLAEGASLMLGDEVQTRQNDRSLTTDEGITVKNGHRWTVDEIDDGSVTVSDDERGQVTLPRTTSPTASTSPTPRQHWPPKAAPSTTPSYSSTAPSTPPASTSPWPGRLSNDVWVVTDGLGLTDAVDLLADIMQQRWVDLPAIDHLDDLSVTEWGGIDL